MKHFSTRPQLGVCCQYQINLAAPGRRQFAASIVGNCQPSKKSDYLTQNQMFNALGSAPLSTFSDDGNDLLRRANL
jgi:hypothetical protein